jgi:hypothetical protein
MAWTAVVCEADHSLLSSAEIKNMWGYTFTPFIRHGVACSWSPGQFYLYLTYSVIHLILLPEIMSFCSD